MQLSMVPRGKYPYLAIAIKCNTALVDPPNAMTTTPLHYLATDK